MNEKPIAERIDEVVAHLEKNEDIRLDNIHTKDSQGVGDTLHKVFEKFGLTEEGIQQASGMRWCGCHKRRQFLNRIFPYRKKADPEQGKD
jgi:hypothetical protein